MNVQITDPGIFVLYEGKLARVVSIGHGKDITLEMVETPNCPTCGNANRVHLFEQSPIFQERVRPVPTC